MSSTVGNKPVFFDLGGKRWPRTRRLLVLLGLALFLSSVVFVQSLLTPPLLVLPVKLKKLKEQLKALQKQGTAQPNVNAANAAAMQEFYKGVTSHGHVAAGKDPAPGRAPRPPRPAGQIRLGFTVGWDPSSFDSLVAHADKLTHVCPEWFTVTTSDGDFHRRQRCRPAAFSVQQTARTPAADDELRRRRPGARGGGKPRPRPGRRAGPVRR